MVANSGGAEPRLSVSGFLVAGVAPLLATVGAPGNTESGAGRIEENASAVS